jgi:hypothetical protein
VSYDYVGDVQTAQTDLAGALKSYRDSFAILARLAQSDPANANWQHDLASSHGKLAAVYDRQSDAAQASAELSAGRAILAALVTLGYAQWMHDLAWFNQQIVRLEAQAQQTKAN